MQFSLWQALKLTINQFFLRNNMVNRSASAYAALAA